MENGGANQNQAPAMAGQDQITTTDGSINTLLEHGLADGLPRIAVARARCCSLTNLPLCSIHYP